ncbi:hypothetical protein P8605_34955 [Streptomyces sp. T-3]|nr:hypothetical protein [Streptomyces sp. T-3]
MDHARTFPAAANASAGPPYPGWSAQPKPGWSAQPKPGWSAQPKPGWSAQVYPGWSAPPPAPETRQDNALLTVGIALWSLTYLSLGLLACFWGIALIFWAAAGGPVGSYVLHALGAVLGAAALLAGLAFAPGIRRLSAAARLALLGALACPVPVALAAWTWSLLG